MEQGNKKMLPIGIEDFEKLRRKDYYYIDKTGLIRELLDNQAEVTLFTRPRRFGKSLNMSMLAHFFSLDGDKSIFDGLKISKEKELCERHMGKYPVVFISLKDIEGDSYQEAYSMMVDLVIDLAARFDFLSDSEKLSAADKERYGKLLDDAMGKNTLTGSLKLLCRLLEKHFGKKVVLLIDEYDVPLARAHAKNYYDMMVSLMRSFLGAALKTNTSLEFAVLTGCLRISKESIFTGLNNLKVLSITDDRCGGYYGFSDGEVKDLLAYYGLSDHYAEIRRWYDGYLFGHTEVYCPWDVLNYCDLLRANPDRKPQNYWINTSGNDVIRRFVAQASDTTRGEIENLVAGEAIEKDIREDLTYSEIYDSIDNLWSLLFTTGYLTSQGRTDEGLLKLKIPNMEVRDVFVKQVREYFKESVKADTDTLDAFCAALVKGDADGVKKCFTRYLRRTVGIRDTMAKDGQKENFYQGVMTGILAVKESWSAKSNRESGDGFADVLVEPEHGDLGIGIVIELKYDSNLDDGCRDALDQIEKRRYAEELVNDGMETILKYGIGCYKKTCKVVLGK